MTFEFTFRGVDSTGDIRKLIDFMASQPQSYQGYMDWIQRTEAEFYRGYKQAVLAFSGRELVGDLVFQTHKQLPRTLELKNLRVHPGLRKRDFGHFMLKQVEAVAQKMKSFDAIMIDARVSQSDVVKLLQFTGYKEIARAPLYDSNEEDVIFVKSLHPVAA